MAPAVGCVTALFAFIEREWDGASTYVVPVRDGITNRYER
jgi:hypothetical protein